MAIINIPPEFDLDYCKETYTALRFVSDEILTNNYKTIALERGYSTCIYDRRESLQKLLQGSIDEYHLKTLEISPWDRPFICGEDVKYFGTEDAETLKRHSAGTSRNIDGIPNKIHFVSPNGDLSVVDEKFHIVFSSHVIEQTPDLVEHLRGVSKILKQGGLYILLVPDKRYCFDYYNSESTIAEVIDAFANERKNPRLADVISSVYMRTHNSPFYHWLGEHGERYGYRKASFEPVIKTKIVDEYFFDDGKGIRPEQILRLVEKYTEALEQGEYISVHNWRFTPESFGYIMRILNALEFIDLSLYRLCHTILGRQEFVAILEKL